MATDCYQDFLFFFVLVVLLFFECNFANHHANALIIATTDVIILQTKICKTSTTPLFVLKNNVKKKNNETMVGNLNQFDVVTLMLAITVINEKKFLFKCNIR